MAPTISWEVINSKLNSYRKVVNRRRVSGNPVKRQNNNFADSILAVCNLADSIKAECNKAVS